MDLEEQSAARTAQERLVSSLDYTARLEARSVRFRGYLVFGLVVLWQLLPGAASQVAICLAVAAGMYWLIAVADLMACHWLSYLAKEHEGFRPRDPDVQFIAAIMDQVLSARARRCGEAE